jgi:hypothetical protein
VIKQPGGSFHLKWKCTFAFGTLALGWLAVAAKAVDPPPASQAKPVVPAALATDQPGSTGLVLATSQPASKDSVNPPASDPEVVSVFNDSSCDPCVCECGGWHFEAGVGLYLFQTFFHEDPAFTTAIYKGTGVYDPFAKGSTTGTQTITTTSKDDDKAYHQSTSTGSISQTTTTTTTTQNIEHIAPSVVNKSFFFASSKFGGPTAPAGGSATAPQAPIEAASSPPPVSPHPPTEPRLSSSVKGAGLTSRQDFGHHMEVSPLIWIGAANSDGLGFRVRWWQLRDSSDAQAVNGDPTGATEISSANILGLSISSPGPTGREGADVWLFHRDLELAVWDVEATQAVDIGAWSLLVTGGARFAHLAQNYSATRSNSGPEHEAGVAVLQDTSVLAAGHNFNGAGPMVSLEGRRPIADTGLLFYGSARGSLLFGQRKQNVNTEEVYAGTLADNTPFGLSHTEAATAHRDTLLPVMELEIGVEYGRRVGQFYPFIRTGLVTQVWFGAGNSLSTDGDLGFLGLEASLGFKF